jgi:hypothetical protein
MRGVTDRNAKAGPVVSSAPGSFMSTSPPSGPSAAVSPIPDIVRGFEAIAVALVSRDGALWDANRGFLSLLRGTELSGAIVDVRSVFVEPTFEVLISRPADPVEGLIYRGIVSLRGATSKLIPVHGAVFAYDADLLLVAEHDIAEVTTLRAKLLAVEAEVAARDQEIEHLRLELDGLRGLAEAALRDRDALLDAISREPTAPPL